MNIKKMFENQQYEQIVLLNDKINSTNEEDILYLTKAFYELGDYEQVKKSIKEYIHEHRYYYEYLCLKVDILLIEEKYLDAAIIIKEELNMPYIEEKYRVKFEESFQYILEKQYKKELSNQDIEQLLNSSEDNQILAITLLKKQNIREYGDVIEEILKSNEYSLKVKNLLLLAMHEQEYETKLELAFDNYFELISVREHVLKQQLLLNKILANVNSKDTSFENAYREITTTIIINTYPQDISEEQYITTIKALSAQMFNLDVTQKVNMELMDYFKSFIY